MASTWDRAYDILQEFCGANEDGRGDFCRTMSGICTEYRFQGSLGFGGKLYASRGKLRVDCYPEDKTPVRAVMIHDANKRLEEINWR